MRRSIRSWTNLLGKLGLQVAEKPASQSRSRHTQRQLSVESLERRDLMATLYWDTNGSTPGLGGAGTWDLSAANWTTDATGSIATQAWNNAAGDDAVFKGTGAAVTIGSGIQASSLKIESSGYTLGSGSLAVNGTGAVNVATGISTTISTQLTGSTELRKTGAGTLTLSASNTLSGGTQIDAGTLRLTNTAGAGTGAIEIGNGTLSLYRSGTTTTYANEITSLSGTTGTLTVDGLGSNTTGTNAIYATGKITVDGTLTVSRLTGGTGQTLFTGNLAGNGILKIANTNGGTAPNSTAIGRVRFEDTANTFAGELDVLSGGNYLSLTPSPSYTTINVATGGYLALLGNTTTTVGSLTGGGTITKNVNANTATLAIGAGNASGTFSGVIGQTALGAGGTVALTKIGTGTVTLSGANTYTGSTTVDGGGTLIVSNNGNNGISKLGMGTITIKNGSTLQVAGTNAIGIGSNKPTEVSIQSGSTLTTADGITAELPHVTLNSGTIASGTPNTNSGSWAFMNGIDVEGVTTSQITASSMYLDGTAPIHIAPGSTLGLGGEFDNTPSRGASTYGVTGDGRLFRYGELVLNRSFEQPNVPTGNHLHTASIPGWELARGNYFEIQDNINNLGGASHGDQHLELDSNPTSSDVKQTLSVMPGSVYTVSFDYRGRPNRTTSDNKIKFQVIENRGGSDVILVNEDIETTNTTTWDSVSYDFQALTDVVRIVFLDTGVHNSLGMFIDNVSCHMRAQADLNFVDPAIADANEADPGAVLIVGQSGTLSVTPEYSATTSAALQVSYDATKVAFYTDLAHTTEYVSGTALASDEITTLYFVTLAAGSTAVDLNWSDGSSYDPLDQVVIQAYAPTVNLDADSDNSGEITEDDDSNETDNAYRAAVPLNDDRDNGGAGVDHATAGTITAENNLTQIIVRELAGLPSGLSTPQQTLHYDTSKLAVYTTADRTTLIDDGDEVEPGTYYVEGKVAGDATLTLKLDIEGTYYEDEVVVAVVKPAYTVTVTPAVSSLPDTQIVDHHGIDNNQGWMDYVSSGPTCLCEKPVKYSTDPSLPTITIKGTFPSDQPSPTTIEYLLKVNGTAVGDWISLTRSDLESAAGKTVQPEIDPADYATGLLELSVELRTTYSSLAVHDTVVKAEAEHVNPTQDGMGENWRTLGFEMLVPVAGGMLHVNDNLTIEHFLDDGSGGYNSPDGDFDDLQPQSDGTKILTDKYGNRRIFSATGQLIQTITANGQETNYTYTDANFDGNAREIASVTDPFGRSITYAYSGGLLATMTDIAGRVTSYAYNTAGRVTTVTDPDPDGAGPRTSPVTTYTYDTQGRTATITVPGNITTSYTYDTTGRIATFTTDGDTWTIESAASRQLQGVASRTSRLIDPRGNVTTTTYDAKFGLPLQIVNELGDTTTFIRDGNGLVTRMYEGTGLHPLVTDYEYDAKGNLLEITYPDLTTETWTYDSTFSRVTSHTDGAGRVTTYSIDSATGDILSVTVGSGTEAATTSFTYTDGTGALPPGLLLTVSDPLDRVTSYAYQTSTSADDFGRLLAVTYAVGTADEASVGFEYDLAGNVTATIDELGRRTEYEFNALDQLTRMLLADPDGAGSQTSPEIIYGYCSCGRQNNVVDALGNNAVHYTFDDHHQVLTMQQAAVGGIQPTYTYTYDLAGNRLSETDPLGQVTSYTYDALNRVSTKTLPDPDGAGPLAAPVWSFTYDTFGNLESATDPLGLVTTYGYNSRHWLIAVTETVGALSRETSYAYDASGLLTSLTDALGRVTSFVYDTLGRLTETTLPDPDGAGPLSAPIYVTAYDKVGNITSEKDALNNVKAYVYDARNRLVQITEADPDGSGPLDSPVTLFVYDDAGQLTSTTDALGRVTTHEYDNLGRLTKTTLSDPSNVLGLARPEYTKTYDAMGNVLTETDALGNTTTYEYDNLYRLTSVASADPDGIGPQTASVIHYIYDLLGQLTSIEDALGRVTSYAHDHLGRLISTTLPDPNGTGSLAAPVYETTYDAVGNVLTETDALGNVTTYEYDGFYRLTKITQADPDGAGPKTSPVSTFTYDLADQLITTTDPLGRTTSYEYDELGRLILTTLPDPDGAGVLTATVYETQYDVVGNVVAGIDALGQTTTYEYDNLYRLTKVAEEDPDGAGPQDSSETKYTYNAVGLVTSMTDPLDRKTTYTYDHLNRLKLTVLPDPDGVGPLAAPATLYSYDAVGNLILETDSLGKSTSYDYDNLYRLIKVTDKNGDDATYSYDKVGNLLSRSDAAGNTTSYEYDDLDRLVEETNQLSLTRTWAYDANGNLLSKTDRNGAETQYAYDALNRTITETWLDGVTVVNTIELSYLANGLLESITDDSSSYTYGYDGLDRLISTSNAGTSGVVETIFSQQYDAVGRVNKVAASIDGVRDFQNDYAYDAQNRLTSLTQSAQTPELGDPTPHAVAYKRVEFDYNADSQYAEIRRYASSGTSDLVAQTAIDYDATGRLTGMAHGQGLSELAAYRWTFDAKNRVASFSSLVDGTAFYTYDDRDQLTGEFYADQYLDDTGTFQAITGAGYLAAGQKNQAYQYDANGNRMRRTEVALPDRFVPSSLAYDPTTAWTPIGNSTTTESYTETGVTVTTTDDFNTNAASTNRLETDGTYDYSYDDQGNRSRRTHIANGTVTVYQWELRNRLTQVVEYADATDADNEVDAIQTIVYRYDMFNRRIGKQVFDDTNTLVKNDRFVWNGGNVAIDFNDADLDGTAERTELSARYLWGQQVDQFFAQENIDDMLSDGETLWGLTDNLGTVRDLAAYDSGTGDATIVDHRTYSAFGELTSGDATLSRYGFTAQEYDADAGMYYYDNRWYDQNVGQFISPDPIQDDLTNDYRYVGNSPMNGVDPSGMKPWLLPWERGASWWPGDTWDLWTTTSLEGHRRGLYTRETEVTPDTHKIMDPAGKSYTQNAGDGHRALNRLGPAGRLTSSVLSSCEGKELNDSIMQQGRLVNDKNNLPGVENLPDEDLQVGADLLNQLQNRKNRPPAQNGAQVFIEGVHDFAPAMLHAAGNIQNQPAANNPGVAAQLQNNPGNAGNQNQAAAAGGILLIPPANDDNNVFRRMVIGPDGKPLPGNHTKNSFLLPRLPAGQFGDLFVPNNNQVADLKPELVNGIWFVNQKNCDGKIQGLSTNIEIKDLPIYRQPKNGPPVPTGVFQVYVPGIPDGLRLINDGTPTNPGHRSISPDNLPLNEANQLYMLMPWQSVFPRQE